MPSFKSLVILKPDALHRNLFNSFIQHLNQHKLSVDEYKFIEKPNQSTIDMHYEEFIDTDWYYKLRDTMTNGPICVMSVVTDSPHFINDKLETVYYTHETAVSCIRNASLAYRQLNQINFTYNTVHSSDSVESAIRELKIWSLYP